MSECKTKCPMCDKRGLPVLVTRYAIAPDNANAKPLSGKFKTKAISLGSKAIYSLRLLRSGYLYVFDEKRNKWEAYFVSPDAFLMPIGLPAADRLTPSVTGDPADIKPCSLSASATVAGCITISSPKQAGIVWLGFSDVEWTPNVLQRHLNDRAYLKRHMRAFDVKKWLASTKHPDAGGIGKVATMITEYNPAVPQSAFDFSTARKVMRMSSQGAKSLVDNCEKMMPGKGAIVALDDPAGIAMDLGALMDHKMHKFSESHQWPLAISASILGLRESVEHQAELEELHSARKLQARMLGENPMISMTENGRKILEKVGTVKAENLETSRQNAWKKYQTKYDETKRNDFQINYQEKLKKFNEEVIAPLAKAHAAWMKNSAMADYCECNFDEANTDSGQVYTSVLNICIGNTQDKGACFDLYSDWLAGSITDKKNLLLRGLVLNQDEYAKTIAKGTQVSVDPRGLPWDGMIGNVGKAIDSVLENKVDILGTLMLRVGGPILGLFKKFSESGALPESLVAMGVISKAPVLRIEFEGNMRDFQKYVIGELLKARGEPTAPRGLVKAIGDEIELLEIKGAKLDGKRSKRFLALADLDALKAVPASGTSNERSRALAKTLANVDDLHKIEMSRWRVDVKTRLTRVREVAGRAAVVMPYAFSVLGAIAQLFAQAKLTEEKEKSLTSGKDVEESKWRYWAGWSAFGGTVSEALGKGMEQSQRVALKLGQGVGRIIPKAMQIAGKAAGFFGAAVMAIFDGMKGFEEIGKGNGGLGAAYITASLLGVAGAILILSSAAAASVIGLVFILAAMAISVLIEYIKDNPVQEWLGSCFFGSCTYPSVDTEIRALKEAGGI